MHNDMYVMSNYLRSEYMQSKLSEIFGNDRGMLVLENFQKLIINNHKES
jgi:hypothetical protein